MWNPFKNWRKKKSQKPKPNTTLLPSNRVLDKLLETWPDLNPGRLWKADAKYVMPTRKNLEKAIFKSPVSGYEYVSEIEDCDDFAILLHADIIRNRYDEYKKGEIPENNQYPWAFGQIWYRSSIGMHAINLCITCDDSILFIEPQTRKIWKPKKDIFISFIRI